MDTPKREGGRETKQPEHVGGRNLVGEHIVKWLSLTQGKRHGELLPGELIVVPGALNTKAVTMRKGVMDIYRR